MNSPPAIMGVLIGLVGSLLRSAFSLQTKTHQFKLSFSKKGCRYLLDSFECALLWSHIFPLEDEVPVETTPQVSRGTNVVKVIHGNDVNDGTNHIGAILHHTLQHRLLQNMQSILFNSSL